jgi:hypothetical protein
VRRACHQSQSVTRVRLDPDDTQLLIEELEQRPDCVCSLLAPGLVEISLLGSYAPDAHALELALRLRAWQAAHPNVDLTVGGDTLR